MQRMLATALLCGLDLTAPAGAATGELSATIGDVGQNYSDGPGIVGLFAAGDSVRFSFDYVADDSVPAGDAHATVKVSVEITADFPEGVSDHIKRAISENATNLDFKNKAWE